MRDLKRPEPKTETITGDEVKELFVKCWNNLKKLTRSGEFLLFKLNRYEYVNKFLNSDKCPKWLMLPVKNEFKEKSDYEIAIRFYFSLVIRTRVPEKM